MKTGYPYGNGKVIQILIKILFIVINYKKKKYRVFHTTNSIYVKEMYIMKKIIDNI